MRLGQGGLQVMTIQPANSISWSGGVVQCSTGSGCQWIGCVGKKLTGNHGFNHQFYRGFRFQCSHHPILCVCVFFFCEVADRCWMQTAYRFTMIYLLILLTPTAHILAQPFQLLACSFKPQPNKTCLRQGCCFQVTEFPTESG
jgi:hypothetical protein